MEPIVQINNLNKSYKDFQLKNIGFTLEKGYIMGLIGPNGSGKTTILKLMLDLLNRDSGDIRLFGIDPTVSPELVKARTGIVYDECPYFDNLSLTNNAQAVSGFFPNWNADLFYDYLERFELKPKMQLRKLSKGMKTKFSIAMALAHEPELLIMDEPTAGLDPVFRNELLELLQSLIEEKEISIIFSTHITTDLDKIADYITYIQDGEVVFSHSMETIRSDYQLIKGPKNDRHLMDHSSIIGVKDNNYGFSAMTADAKALKPLLSEQSVIEPINLEDIMVYHALGGAKL